MRAFVAAPGKQQIDYRQSSRANRQAGGVAVRQVVKSELAGPQRDSAFSHHERCPDRPFVNRMLEARSQNHEVRSAKAVIGKARKKRYGVKVRSANRRVQVERRHVTGGGIGSGVEKLQ